MAPFMYSCESNATLSQARDAAKYVQYINEEVKSYLRSYYLDYFPPTLFRDPKET